MKIKEKKMSNLTTLEAQREALRTSLKNFNVQPKDEQPPASVKVLDGHRELKFKFEDGKCIETPPAWSWALRWRWTDLMQYFRVHAYKVVLQEEQPSA